MQGLNGVNYYGVRIYRFVVNLTTLTITRRKEAAEVYLASANSAIELVGRPDSSLFQALCPQQCEQTNDECSGRDEPEHRNAKVPPWGTDVGVLHVDRFPRLTVAIEVEWSLHGSDCKYGCHHQQQTTNDP